jgi:hypothetical protein
MNQRYFASLNMTKQWCLELGIWDFRLKRSLAGDTSKALDKYVVVRVILHGQCILQRKEAI